MHIEHTELRWAHLRRRPSRRGIFASLSNRNGVKLTKDFFQMSMWKSCSRLQKNGFDVLKLLKKHLMSHMQYKLFQIRYWLPNALVPWGLRTYEHLESQGCVWPLKIFQKTLDFSAGFRRISLDFEFLFQGNRFQSLPKNPTTLLATLVRFWLHLCDRKDFGKSAACGL